MRPWWAFLVALVLAGCGSQPAELDAAPEGVPFGIDEITWPASSSEIVQLLNDLPQDLDGRPKGQIQMDYPPEPELGESSGPSPTPWLLATAYEEPSGREAAEVTVSQPEEGATWDLAGLMVLACQRSPEQEASEALAPVLAAPGLREAQREIRALEQSPSDEFLWYSCTSTYDAWNDEKLRPDEYEYITEWAVDGWVYAVTSDQASLRDSLTEALTVSARATS